MRTPPASRRGFTLIELMIVIAILAVLMAIAIPALSMSRMAGNEASAIASLRALNTVNEQYRQRFGTFAGTLNDLVTVGYIDNNLGSGTKAGYDFSGYAGAGTTWTCTANPITPGRSGERGFFVDQSGVIRFVTSGTATSADGPVD